MNNFTIAIDGPAGAGKSSVAKLLAKKLGYLHIDTGAMYRAITWYLLKNKISIDITQIKENLKNIELHMQPTEEAFNIGVNDVDVTQLIRTYEVSENVSQVASFKEVREFLLNEQRKLAENGKVILDGRDVCSIILPNADIKFYLTASVESRAKRRWLELKEKNEEHSLEEICEAVKKRDYNDMNRVESPLVCVPDAIVVDSSEMTLNETVDYMYNYIKNFKR